MEFFNLIFPNRQASAISSAPIMILFALLTVWALVWKAIALWHAAGCRQKYWFVVLLVANTLGILEIIYLFKYAKKRLTLREVTNFLKSALPAK